MKTMILAAIATLTLAAPAMAQTTMIYQTGPDSALVTEPGGTPHVVMTYHNGDETTYVPRQAFQPSNPNPHNDDWQQFLPGHQRQ